MKPILEKKTSNKHNITADADKIYYKYYTVYLKNINLQTGGSST